MIKVIVIKTTDMVQPGCTMPGVLRAYASIQIGPLTLHQVRLNKRPGGKWDVSPPQREYVSAGGKLILTPLAEWPAGWDEPILEAVKTSYDALQGLFI